MSKVELCSNTNMVISWWRYYFCTTVALLIRTMTLCCINNLCFIAPSDSALHNISFTWVRIKCYKDFPSQSITITHHTIPTWSDALAKPVETSLILKKFVIMMELRKFLLSARSVLAYVSWVLVWSQRSSPQNFQNPAKFTLRVFPVQVARLSQGAMIYNVPSKLLAMVKHQGHSYLFSSLSSFCHVRSPLIVTLSYHMTCEPRMAACILCVSRLTKYLRFSICVI